MIVEVTRAELVESQHQVDYCVVDERNEVVVADGDVWNPIFLRSAAKPFIAAAVIAGGARERFGLTPEEIAVMAASHSGESFHVDAVASILRKLGLTPDVLQCGVHLPYNEVTAHAMLRSGEPPTALHNNCSGKHAGIIALAVCLGVDPAGYLDLSHPAQRTILDFCARMSDEDPNQWPLGVDGCGIPVYATSLRNAALAFMRLATLRGVSDHDAMALLLVRDAMIAHPRFVAGTAQLDTLLIEAGRGNIVCKVGAEGVHGVGICEAGIGFASKVLDGASRARGPSTISALSHLGVLSVPIQSELAHLSRPIVYNRAGRRVGEIRVRNVAVLEASSHTE